MLCFFVEKPGSWTITKTIAFIAEGRSKKQEGRSKKEEAIKTHVSAIEKVLNVGRCC